ncbi:MAG: hypothetical protein AAGA20_15060 [Planctomycetota bacterium]
MRFLFPDLSRFVSVGSERPASLPLIREATASGLRTFGHEATASHDVDAGDVDLALVDVTDAPSADALAALHALRSKGVPVVLRVHGAWAGPDESDAEAPGAGELPVSLKGLLELSDRVLVSTRSHLVRLASKHVIDVERVKLLAPPHPEFRSEAGTGAADGPGVGLVIGERSSLGYEGAVSALAGAGLEVERFDVRQSDHATCGAFRAAVSRAHAIAVVAAVPWSDRVIVDACLVAGPPVVAACGPVLEEGSASARLVRLPLDATDEEWTGGIAAALRAGPDARRGADDAEDARAESVRRLTAILFEAAASGGDGARQRAA